MKKIFNILIALFVFASAAQAQQTACCPEFKMVFKRDFDCTKEGPCLQGPIGGNEEHFTASMCKYSTNTFLVVPNLPGYTYAWVITGGTPTAATGNPVSITWGGGGTGTIMVTITSADGSCKKTIKETICLRDAPVASFTFIQNSPCAGGLVSFSNTSTGAAGVSWDFGDGNFAGNVNNPTHVYAAPGVYNVTIYVTNDTTDCRPSTPPGQGQKPCCGCTSSFTLQVTVIAGSPLLIVPKECINQCLCAGDTAEYCITVPCAGPITWSVSPGSTIISGQGTQCVKVVWGNTYPTTISVSAPNCGNPCGNTATLNVPVLVNNIPIMPLNNLVCQFSTQTYSLPAMPGVFYNWAVTGGTIVGPNVNTSVITVSWGAGPTGQITCTYNNPLKKNCSGTSTKNVIIKPVLKINGPSQSCVGCTAFFSTAGGPVTWSGSPGLTFSPPSGPNTIVSFPVSATTNTYTITGTGGAGVYCNSPVSAFIVVAPRPVLTILPASAIACPNTPVTFVATSTVTTTPINWVLPGGATMIANSGPQLDTAVISFANIPVGGVTVTAMQNCAFNLACSQGTASVTVKKPQAPSLAIPPSPCIDQTSSYSISNYISGITYTWTISNNLGTITLGQGSGTINVLWHGNNAVANMGTITVSNCGGSVSVPVTVTLPVYPTITVGGTCIKNGMTLTSSTAGPYLWSGPGVTGQTTQTVNINQSGTYCVTVNPNAPGSCGQVKCITIPPNPYWVKIIPPCSVSSCNPATLSVLLTVATNIPSPTNCQWLYQPPGGGPFTVVSTTCGNYTATLLGTYYMVITDPNGCNDTSNIIRIPQDINICCTTPVCSALSGVQFNFTHAGCQPTAFTGSPLVLPPGWTTGTIHPTICYGDGTSDDFISLNTTHQYPAAGLYTACVVQKVVKISTNDTCCIISCRQVIIPVVTKFTASYNCNTGFLTMTDGSSYYPSAAGAVYTWTYSGAYTGTLTNGPNQSITPTASGNFTITLSITLNGCTSTYSMPILVVLPVAPITINPNPSCDGSPVFFSTTAGMASYNWQFGDNSFSLMASPQHIYPGPGTYTVTLTVVTPEGCTVVNTATVTIQPKPIVTISPNPVTICPGTSVTLTASINANGNTMCSTFSSYTFQWYNNGNPVGTNTTTLTATNYGTYYAVLTGNSPACNCVITTDTVTVSWYPKPIAKIKGNSAVCINVNTGTGTINLSNTVSGYPTYNWSANSGSVTFNFNNIYNPVATITAAGNYQIFLQVIDAYGCMAYDTLCIYASNSPTVIVNAPGGTLCSGNVYSLQAVPTPATAPPAGYNYIWNNGATTNTINVSAPGGYNAIVTDMNTGCSAISNSVFINEGPDLSLFPSCCDTICSDAPINIIPPLPLGPGQTACTLYTIVWLDNGVPISPQPSPCNTLNTATLVPLLGMHNISIAVTLNGCTDTSNVFQLYIKDCECDCKESKWDKITLTKGKTEIDPKDPNDDPALAKSGKAVVIDNPNTISINCDKTYKLDCNKPYTINAGYLCKDTACPAKVTYSLQPPSGAPVTGTMPPALNFTPTLNGTYVLTMYGWCGDKICDTCIIKFEVNCVACDCKGSKWGERMVTIEDKTQQFSCRQEYDVKCKKPVTVFANYMCADAKCNGVVTYSMQPPSGAPTTGSIPPAYTFTPLLPGTYTLTLYGWCGTTKCDSCVIKFKTDCKQDDCCPYDIKATTGTVKYDYTQIPNATVAAQTFTINGLALASITEVRANVISYDITDNFGKECMKCVNLPFTWASIASAANIAAAPGLITMYGGATVASFNGSGADAYKNPREVIWNNGSPIAIPNGTNIGLNFILPPVPAIDCCELKGKICVKFTFRDKDCKECEVIACFDFVIKKK